MTKKQLLVADGGVECSFQRDGFGVIIFTVVGKDHNLCQIDKAPKLFIFNTHQHTVIFSLDSTLVIGLLDLNKSQRKTVDQWCDIRAKFIRTILASHLCDHMIIVDCPSEIFKINQFQAVVSIDENGIKLPAQIIVFQHCFQSIDNFLGICGSQRSSIDPIDCITKNIDQNVGIVVDDSFIFSQRDVFISQTSEMHQCRNFDSRVFIVRHCAILLCGRISFFLMISTYKCGFDCCPLQQSFPQRSSR